MKVINFFFRSVCCFIFLLACGCSLFKDEPTLISAVQWPEANTLFRQDPHWRGSDDAYSVKLGEDRLLWLFGDTLISDKSKIIPRSPGHIKTVRNTVGIQTGMNPAVGTIKYYWNDNNNSSNPKSFFRSPYIAKDNWLWPGDCTLLPDDETLIIFFMNLKSTPEFFDIDGYQVAIINNSYDPPDKWDIQWIKNVSEYDKLKILLGSGGVLVEGDYLYAYGFSNNKNIKGITLARWDLMLFEKIKPDLSNPQWWTGTTGWIKENELNELNPIMLWDNQQTEFTVTKMGKKLYVMFQAYPQNGFFGNANMVYRVSRSLTGPWSEQFVLYEKLCRDNPCPKDIVVYAGKYHPELTGVDFVFTYAANVMNSKALWNWQSIYYPRFLKMNSKTFLEQLRVRVSRLGNRE